MSRTRGAGTAAIKNKRRLCSLVAAGAIAVGYSAIGVGYPSIAGADPNNGGSDTTEWDIGAYDFCMNNHPPLYTTEDVLDHKRWCCESTGGVWGSGDNGCHAPPGEASAPIGPGQPPGQVAPPNMAPPPTTTTAPPNISNLPGSFG